MGLLSRADRDPLPALGLTDAERAALDKWMGTTASVPMDGLWEFVGRNHDSGCDPPAGSALPKTSLLKGLLAVAEQESDEHGGGVAPGGIRRALSRHWIEFAVLTFALLVAAGVARIKVVQAQ